MTIGEYPCCGEPLMLETPEMTPSYAPEDCPHCGATVWHRFSRIDPQSWTEAEFLKLYVVDSVTKKLTPREAGTVQ